MRDESTDIAVLKQLVLLGRYITASEGVKTLYICIVDIPDGKAVSILDAILYFLDGKLLNIAKLRGFGSDGAAVMTGRLTGVSTRLKAHAPRLISIHCANHRLALAAAHAADHIPYLKRFKTNIHSLFWFYQNSSVRLAGLHAIQGVLNDPQIKFKEAKDVIFYREQCATDGCLSGHLHHAQHLSNNYVYLHVIITEITIEIYMYMTYDVFWARLFIITSSDTDM